MPVCALCENVQAAGEACDVCGHAFPAGVAVPVPVAPLEGLEATSVEPVEVAAERISELEVTRADPVDVVASAMEGLEPTAAEAVPDDGEAPEPAAVCRYCRTPAQAGEAFCAHCGMRLPATTGGAEAPLAVVLCRDCGTPVRGARCPSCGLVPER
jgi:hypothetical protein